MSKRIGERLVEAGLISPQQLDKALKAQLILGGHLGTNLIELGYVDEVSLGEALADQFGLAYASPDVLGQVDQPVIQSVSWKLVEKYKAVPIKVDERTLHVAVVDPRNLSALSSVTGKKIVPWIAPEVRIFEAMERYYDIPRRPRYITICHELERVRTARDGAAVARSVETDAAADEARPALPRIGRQLDGGEGRAQPRTLDDFDSDFGYGRHWSEFADGLFEDDPRGDRPESPDPDAPAPEPAPPSGPSRGGARSRRTGNGDLGTVSAQMSRADDKNELARAVLEHVSSDLVHAMLFAVRAETATIWDWQGPRFDRRRVSALRFPVTSGSIFSLLLGRTHYFGPVPDESDCRWFYGALQIDVPQEILLLPIYLDDRLVAIFYGDGGPDRRIGCDLGRYQRLAQKLALALNMIILKLKIRAD